MLFSSKLKILSDIRHTHTHQNHPLPHNNAIPIDKSLHQTPTHFLSHLMASSTSLLLSLPFHPPTFRTQKPTLAHHHHHNHHQQHHHLRNDSRFASLRIGKFGNFRSKEYVGHRRILTLASIDTVDEEEEDVLIGEKSAEFDLDKQKITSWVYFAVVLGVVLFVLDLIWIDNSTGFGKDFVDAVGSLSQSHEITMLLLILIFAIVHSGLASLRDVGEKLIGERAFRVLFAGLSLPLAVSTVVYFINHRYDGVQLWQVQGVPGVHELVWISNFISFFFLYPSTFNLLEVAAVDKPKMHLWETGIMRITRHPQMVGQVMWCLAHSLWIGNSVVLAASVGLIGHHLFGVWNGDRRLAKRYGEKFEVLKSRTSVVPFAAILDGRQKLPKDYYKEFIKLPYIVITALTLGAYFAHPLMQAGSYGLHW